MGMLILNNFYHFFIIFFSQLHIHIEDINIFVKLILELSKSWYTKMSIEVYLLTYKQFNE